MLITLDNGQISLVVDTLGAQMMNLIKDGVEYLWQGDPQYWSRRAPVLFPFIERLWNGAYRDCDKTYPMGIHGFASKSEFVPTENSNTSVELTLTSNSETMTDYPFAFNFSFIYTLIGDSVEVTYRVRNLNNKALSFAVGGHPGFNGPFTNGENFEDYYLEFSTVCQPDRIVFTSSELLSSHNDKYEMESDKYINLRHDLFDDDAIILQNVCREIILRSKKSDRFVKVSYPDMPYLGLWHCPKTDAPYLCIKPWTSLPGRQYVTEELSCRSDLIHLKSNEVYQNVWTTIGGECV